MLQKKSADKNPMAINILKLQRYNFDFFSLEEVVFFEYMVIKAKSFGYVPFFHSTATIAKETGIKRAKLDSILAKFKKLGLIKVEIKGFPKVKTFTVDFIKVQFFLPQIYQSAENGKLSAEMSKLLADFYTPFVDSYQKKNKLERILKETIKETQERDSDWDAFILFFNDLLLDLKNEFNLQASSLNYEPLELHRAYKQYDQEIIIAALRKYFARRDFKSKVQDFLKPEALNNKKVISIESFLADEKRYVKNFIEQMNNTYNHRREKKKEKGKKYPATKLPVNHSIESQIAELLRHRSEQEISDAFVVYCDEVLNKNITPNKFLPYFLAKNNLGEYTVIDSMLDYYNLNYVTYTS